MLPLVQVLEFAESFSHRLFSDINHNEADMAPQDCRRLYYNILLLPCYMASLYFQRIHFPPSCNYLPCMSCFLQLYLLLPLYGAHAQRQNLLMPTHFGQKPFVQDHSANNLCMLQIYYLNRKNQDEIV